MTGGYHQSAGHSAAEHDPLLVLVRHGESEGNRQNRFTGWHDLDLTARGVEEAEAAGRALAAGGFRFRHAFSSALIRARRSARLALDVIGSQVEIEASAALNERDYGALTDLDKDEARARWGAEQVQIWRRSYDVAPPGGESLRDTSARVLPFFIRHILPAVLGRGPVLLVAHGNSIRALIMALDGLSPDEIARLEIATGEVHVYRFKADASVAERRRLQLPGLAAPRVETKP